MDEEPVGTIREQTAHLTKQIALTNVSIFRKFWIPSPSKLVVDDFQKLFNAHPVKDSKCVMGMFPGCYAVLLKPIPDYEKAWSDVQFLGKWRFDKKKSEEESSDIKSKPKDSSRSEERYLEIECNWYNLKHISLSSRILGGEPYVYVWKRGDFQPLILMSEDEERCGAIGIINNVRQPCFNVPNLNDVAARAPARILLTRLQIEELKEELAIPHQESIFPNLICSLISADEDHHKTISIGLVTPSSSKTPPELTKKQIEVLMERLNSYIKNNQKYFVQDVAC